MSGLSVIVGGSISILAVWCLVGGLLIGIGALMGRPGNVTPDELFRHFWVGLALLLVYLHLWHFVLPVRWPVHVLPLAAGVVGLIRLVGSIRKRRSVRLTGRSFLWLALTLCGALWLAHRAMGPVAAYDSGMYHLPFVAWAKAHPVVPGLGNLHGRLAFNNSNLLLAAMLDAGPWSGGASHLVNGLLLLVLFLRASLGFLRLGHSDLCRVVSVYDSLLLGPWVVYALSPIDISSLNIDAAVAVAVFFAGHWLLEVVVAGPGAESAPARVLPLIATLAVVVAFKLTAVPFASMAAAVAVARVARAGRPARGQLVRAAILAGALAATWTGRGLVLSGYPAFPATVGAAPVEWKVPAEHGEALRAWIRHYGRHIAEPDARYDGGGLTRTDWVPSWVDRVLEHHRYFWLFAYPALLLMAATALLALVALLPGGGTRRGRRAWWLALPAGAALVVWFVTAPRPEFGSPFLWILVGLVAAWSSARVSGALGPRLTTAGTRIAVALVVAGPVVYPAALQARASGRTVASAMRTTLVYHPAGDWLRNVPSPRTTEFTTASGLRLRVPTGDNRCWLAEPPCTPHPAENLRLRKPGDPGFGFVTNGVWMQRRWPAADLPFLSSWSAQKQGTPQ